MVARQRHGSTRLFRRRGATSFQLSGPAGLALDASGNLYIADLDNSVFRKVTASRLQFPTVDGESPTWPFLGLSRPPSRAAVGPSSGFECCQVAGKRSFKFPGQLPHQLLILLVLLQQGFPLGTLG